jgi:hypothetical protein
VKGYGFFALDLEIPFQSRRAPELSADLAQRGAEWIPPVDRGIGISLRSTPAEGEERRDLSRLSGRLFFGSILLAAQKK